MSNKIVWNSKGVECENCQNWYNINFTGKIKSQERYETKGYDVWKCFEFENSQNDNQAKKRIERFIDDIICTVKSNPNDLLQLENNLQKKLQITMEKMDEKHKLAFLDMAVYVDERKMSPLSCTKCQRTLEKISTRVADLQRNPQVGQHVSNYLGKSRAFDWCIID